MPLIGPIKPVAPSLGTQGAQGTTPGGGGQGFGNMLSGAVDKLDNMQTQANTASQQLATGQASDISQVTMQVENASLALQLAVEVRNKAVDAYQDLFRMQV
jgi:flagellar hook-basal body complex protein FliE